MAGKTKQKDPQLSELEIIELIQKKWSHTDQRVLVGLGDDAAVLCPGGRLDTARRLNLANQIITTDLLVEGVHFDLSYLRHSDIGYKALAVSFSDIAAMGGEPAFAFGTLGVPAATSKSQVLDLLDGVWQAADNCGVQLIGGDTVAAPQWIIGFTVIGDLHHNALLRSGAKPGDTIWHSGVIGLSQTGFHLLCGGEGVRTNDAKMAHARPEAQLELGRFLAKEMLASACLDLSDSLSQCLLQLAQASGVGIVVDFNGYPFDQRVGTFVKGRTRGRKSGNTKFSVPARMQPDGKGQSYDSFAQYLLASAEDYQLLFTTPPEASLQLINHSPVPVTKLGTIVDQAEGKHYRDENGHSHELKFSGFLHL